MFGFLSGMMPMFSGATAKFGLPQNFLPTMAHIESSGNPRLVNPKSGAAGLFQFMPDTAKSYGLKNPMDPIASTDAAARLARDNMKGLQTALGRPPTSAELYLAHQQGLGGAKALLANPGVNAVDALTPLYKSRSVAHQAIVNNGGDPGQAMIGPVAPNVAPNVTPLAVQGGQVASGPTGPFNFQPSFAPDDVVGYQREMAARGGQPMPPAPVAASVAGSAAGPATVPGGTPFSALPQLFGQGGGAKIAPLSVGPTAVQVGMAPMQAGVQTDARGQPIRLPIPGNGSPAFSATNPFWFFGWPPTGR